MSDGSYYDDTDDEIEKPAISTTAPNGVQTIDSTIYYAIHALLEEKLTDAEIHQVANAASWQLQTSGRQFLRVPRVVKKLAALSVTIDYATPQGDPRTLTLTFADGSLRKTERWKAGADPTVTRDCVLLAGMNGEPTVEQADEWLRIIETWTQEQRAEVEHYCASVHLRASDNDDVAVPERPDILAELET